MNKFIYTLLFTCNLFVKIDARPNLYGLINSGGKGGTGTILNFQPAANTVTPVFNFDIIPANSSSNLTLANDGKLYGLTQGGGRTGGGIMFSCDPSNDSFSIVKSFDDSTGNQPYGSMIPGKHKCLVL